MKSNLKKFYPLDMPEVKAFYLYINYICMSFMYIVANLINHVNYYLTKICNRWENLALSLSCISLSCIL